MRSFWIRSCSVLGAGIPFAVFPNVGLADEGSLQDKRNFLFKKIYEPTVPLRKPDPLVKSYPWSREEIDKKIKENESYIKLESGTIESYSTNYFAVSDPFEDSHNVRPQLSQVPGLLAMVADGHSGEVASYFLRDNLFNFLEVFQASFKSSSLLNPDFFELADELFLTSKYDKVETKKHAHHGAVYCCAHVKEKDIEVAWAGDVRALVGRRVGDGYETISLTKDHQHNLHPGERERLLSMHPCEPNVLNRNRVKGHLQPTRAFGDGPYKRMELFYESDRFHHLHPNWTPPYVTAVPEVAPVYDIHPDDEFLILACDGLFQELHNEELVRILGQHLSTDPSSRESSASVLVEAALLAAGEFKHGRLKTHEENLTKILELPRKKRRKVHDDITVIVLFFRPFGDENRKEAERTKPIPKIPAEYLEYFTEEFTEAFLFPSQSSDPTKVTKDNNEQLNDISIE